MKRKNIIVLGTLFILIVIGNLVIYKNIMDIKNNRYFLKIIIQNIGDMRNFKKTINKDAEKVLEKYPEFNKMIISANIEIPLKDGFVPQGITKLNRYILVCGYMDNGENSKCYVLSQRGRVVNEVILDTDTHVGAVSYDKKNRLIWIPDNDGKLNAYNSKDFLSKMKIKHHYQFSDLGKEFIDYKDKDKNSIDYLDVDDKYLYIGNFSIGSEGLVKRYLINDKVNLEFDNMFYLPAKVQGMSIYKNKYIITSNSFNRKKTSYLNVFLYDNKIGIKDDYIKKLELPPMAEQIMIDNNNLYILFESGARKYSDALDRMLYICVIDLKKFIF